MRLTKHTDYAFRVLIHLLLRGEDELTTIQDISSRFSISRSHLMKIVQKLAAAGIVTAIRGKGGGLRLAQEQYTTTLREVVELMESTMDPINCKQPMCLFSGGCTLKSILCQAQEQYLSYLEQYTLADLADTQVLQSLETDATEFSV